jgi:ketosteroid isomerase-like protein
MATRRWFLAVLGASVIGGGVVRAAGVEPPPDGEPILGGEQDVAAAQDRRIAATIGADLAALGAMMTDDLTYTHSGGVTETKAEFLDGLKTGKYVYREIVARDRRIRVHGDAAVVSGPCHVVVEPGGKRTELDLYFTELYVKEGGQWRMALWQATRLPAPAPTTK